MSNSKNYQVASIFARPTAVNTDKNFADCGSFWYANLSGATRKAAKAMSAMPMLTTLFTDCSNVIENFKNNEDSFYINNKAYSFNLSDIKLAIVNYQTLQLSNISALSVNTAKSIFGTTGIQAILIPFDSSLATADSTIKDISLLTIQLLDGSVYTNGIQIRQSDKYIIDLDITSKVKSQNWQTDTANAYKKLLELLKNKYAYTNLIGKITYNAKCNKQSTLSTSIYNPILGLSSIPVGEEVQQASNYIKGSEQSVKQFEGVLNAMFGGACVDTQAKLTSVKSVSFDPKKSSYQFDTDAFSNINRGDPDEDLVNTTLYKGDYYFKPINVYYNNGKDNWWNPATNFWTTNFEVLLNDRTTGPLAGGGLYLNEICCKKYATTNPILIDTLSHEPSGDYPDGYLHFEVTNASSTDYLADIDWGESLNVLINQYYLDENDQLNFYFKTSLYNAAIVEINLEKIKSVFNITWKEQLKTLKVVADNICPIDRILIYRIKVPSTTAGSYNWYNLDDFLNTI